MGVRKNGRRQIRSDTQNESSPTQVCGYVGNPPSNSDRMGRPRVHCRVTYLVAMSISRLLGITPYSGRYKGGRTCPHQLRIEGISICNQRGQSSPCSLRVEHERFLETGIYRCYLNTETGLCGQNPSTLFQNPDFTEAPY